MGFLSGPQPAQNNPPINPQYYEPSRFVISAITRGSTTTVTTSEDNNYVVGQEVRLVIPKFYGIYQINEQTGIVISQPTSTQLVINIDSRTYDAFISVPVSDAQSPQILAIGDVNSGVINSSGRVNIGTFIPGSFIDISPA